MKTQINLTTDPWDLNRFENRAALMALLDDFDGLELMCMEADARNIIPAEKVIGIHMTAIPYWLDFWRGDLEACAREFGSADRMRAYYGGDTREALLNRFRRDLRFARKYKAEYMVFHIADSSMRETLTGAYRHSDAEVIDAACALLNALLRDEPTDIALLLENLWEPGLKFTDAKMTERLLAGIEYPNKGIMLDTGHLMHTNAALQTQEEALAYIHEMLDRHGELNRFVRGVHLHQSLTGDYMRSVAAHPPQIAEDYEARQEQLFAYIFKLDLHKPFTAPGVDDLIQRIAPEYLTYEFISASLEEHKQMLRCQRSALRR